MNRGWLRASIAIAGVLMPSLAHTAPSRTPAEFYKGRNIFITVGRWFAEGRTLHLHRGA